MKALWLLAGFALLALAILGALLPGVPTTVFAIGAAGCFARSSPRLEAWLLGQPRLGPAVLAWRMERAIPRSAKRVAVASMAASGLLVAVTAPTTVALGVGAVLLGSGLYVWTRPDSARPSGAAGLARPRARGLAPERVALHELPEA